MAEAQYVGNTPRERRGDPGDKTLRGYILKYDKEANPRELRRMTEDGSLEAYLTGQINAMRKYARSLIGENEIPAHAWRRAMRTYIYGKDDD